MIYSYSNSLRRLLEDLVKQPFENHPHTPAWGDYVINTNYTYQTILDQGRTNFDEFFYNLPPGDKVLLYCIHYMPMHLASSYHIFRVHEQVFTTHLRSVNNKIVFIDFGCGPLTSGLAFHDTAWQGNISYLGVESSQAMHDKAMEINQYSPCFSGFELISDYSQLPDLLENIITENDKTPIIFNFCYFLASYTLNISHLSDAMAQIVDKYCNHNMCIVYQNPNLPKLHKNWECLIEHLAGFRSITQSNIEKFSFDRLTYGSVYNASVYYDILCNW